MQSICKINEENKITIFIKKLDDGKKLKSYLGKLTQLHPSVFSIKRLDKFPLNKNYKISYDNKNLNWFMKEINKLFEIPPYSLSEEKKFIFFKEKKHKR